MARLQIASAGPVRRAAKVRGRGRAARGIPGAAAVLAALAWAPVPAGAEVTVTSSADPLFAEVATQGQFANDRPPGVFDQPNVDVSAHAELEGGRADMSLHATVNASPTSASATASGTTDIEHCCTEDENGDFIPQTGAGAGNGFSITICSDQRATFSASVSGNVQANGDGSTNVFASLCCDANGDTINVEGEDSSIGPTMNASRSGVLNDGSKDSSSCVSISAGASSSLDTGQPTSVTQWTLSVSVSELGPDDGTVFRWVGPAQGAFAEAGNWQNENGGEGVPGFRSFEDADTAIVQGAGNVTMDLGGGLSRGPLPRGVERRTGRKQIQSTQALRPVGGTLILDSLEPGLSERSLEIGGAKLLLDAGGVKARHVIVGLGGDGEIEVVGPDGFFTTEGRLGLGGDSAGLVRIRNGAQVTSAETVLGEENGQGSAVVEGAGTLWQTGNLAVGLADDAGLFVDAGARVESENAFVDCHVAAGPNVPGCSGLAGEEKAEVTLTGSANGTPSTWALTGDLEIGARGKVTVEGGAVLDPALLRVGTSGSEADCLAGRACLEVIDGTVPADGIVVGVNGAGKLSIGSAGRVSGLAAVGIGNASGSRGEVVVTGPSSEPQLTGDFLIGNEIGSHGELLIENGASVASGRGTIGGEPGSFGLVEIQANGAAPDATVLQVNGSGSGVLDLGVDLAAPDASVFGATGELALAGGRVELNDADLEIHGTGAVTGTGRIDGFGVSFVSNGGRIGCGVLVNAPYTQSPDGVLECPQASLPAAPQLNPLLASRFARAVRAKIAPPPPPPPGPFVVTGDATLDGSLVLQFLNGFAPSQGDAFELLDVSGNVTGNFANFSFRGLAPGADFAHDLVGGKITAVALNDAVALPTVSMTAKPTLKEKKKAGAKVKLTRDGDTSAPLLVSYVIRGTAKNGVDYDLLPGTLEIPARKRSAKLVIRPRRDALVEGPETIELELLPGADYTPSLFSEVSIELTSADVIPEPKKKPRR